MFLKCGFLREMLVAVPDPYGEVEEPKSRETGDDSSRCSDTPAETLDPVRCCVMERDRMPTQ